MYIMPNYQQSKIYKIISPHTDKIYIGSTTKQYIACRKAVHKKHYQMWKDDNTKQYCSSFELYDLGDIEYILLEAYECNSKDELRARERYWIEQNINNIVNIVKRPIASKEEQNQRKKDYNVENKEYMAIKKKEYEIANKEHLKEKRDEWHEANKEHVKEYKKLWMRQKRAAKKASQQL